MIYTPHDQRHSQGAFQQWRRWTNNIFLLSLTTLLKQTKYIVIVFITTPRHDDDRAWLGRDHGTRWWKGTAMRWWKSTKWWWNTMTEGQVRQCEIWCRGSRRTWYFFFHTLLIFIGYGIGWCWCQSGWYSCLYHGIFIFVFYMLSENFLTILWFGNYLIC